MKKLNIIMFDGSFKTTAFINRLISGLSKKGHKLFVIGFNTDSCDKLSGVSYIDLGNENNKLNFVLSSLRLAIFSLFKPNGLQRLYKVIKATVKSDGIGLKKLNVLNSVYYTNADILHLQWPSLMLFCESVKVDTNCKIVLSQRGYHINVRPFINEVNRNQLKNWYQKVDGFHSVSNAIKEKSRLIFNQPQKIDNVIYSGIDINSFSFLEDYKEDSVLRIISVGRPHWIKGYPFLLKVCRELKKHNINFTYTIVGAKNDEELTYLVKDYKLTGDVVLTPKMPQSEVFDLMRKSTLLILPSVDEGLANVVIEAMALGLPVISTNVGGMPELVKHNETGWLVPFNDTNALFTQIKLFINTNIEDINKVRLAARKKVEEQHNIGNMISEFENLYYQCFVEN